MPIVLAGASMMSVAACGPDTSYENTPRPPVILNVAASITDQQVVVSPTRFGAGPIVLIVTNQSDASQVATLEVNELASSPSRPKKAGLRQTTGPINPRDTAQLRAVVEDGTTYTLKTDDDKIDPAKITVAGKRSSAQNDIGQP